MGSTSSIVISFSIAILLLLVLLLLISYNSNCKVDKVERFVDDNSMYNITGSYIKDGENDMTLHTPNFSPPIRSSVANKDPYLMKTDDRDMTSGTQYNDPITPYEENSQFSDTYGINNTETFENPSNNEDPTSCFKRDRLTKDDLLPKDVNVKWATINPSSAGDITDKNFLTAGYHIGVNTVGQSLRNANLQLRSEIPNPQIAVSPWMISTIEPDVRPVSFEIGSSPSY